jgi:flagellar motility protein MotE (MotC chaperone)
MSDTVRPSGAVPVRQLQRIGLAIWVMGIILVMFPGAGLLRAEAAAETKKILVLPGEIELISSLRHREAAIARKEKELTAREELIRELEKEATAKINRLIELQKDVQERLSEIKEVEDGNFRNLVRIYNSMKPASTALILNQMEEEKAVKILRAMKTEVVAQIISRLDRDKAVQVSKQLGMID